MNSEGNEQSPATPVFTPIDQHLFESRIVFLSGEVNSEQALKVNRQLLAMERASATLPIVLWIDCPGGEVFSGFSIYDTIRFIQPKTYTLVSGLAASMGSVIALAAEKEHRLAMPNAKFLIHQPLIAGAMRGNASELEIHAADIIATKRRLENLYADRTGTPLATYQKLMDRDHWIDPGRALDLGLISQIVKDRRELDEVILDG